MAIVAIIAGVFLLVAAFLVLYGIVTDPMRIDEEEDKEVEQATPQERRGFLRSYKRLSHEERQDRLAEQAKTGYGEGEINDL